jgi:serine/threonine protein kinase/Tol biopolymer transport system component
LSTARDQQIRALYKAALERPLAERASFVADLSGGDQEICRSVELMLSRHGATDVGASAAAPAEATEELAAATEIGTYRIDGVLGRGGMGVVYRATDNKLHRPVAIKFLSIVADEQAKRRFRQEAETASGLNHPHIVTVYDVGEHGGQQYIVSELVEGGTLEEWNRTTRRKGWRQSVELLTGVADALAAAHAAGVLHRDVKPGNVLIDANGYAKLADFGLAKLVDRGGRDPAESIAKISKNTRAGLVLGTVAYMSPEQASGQSVDERSDVFSFGIVLYELIAGHRPFEAGNELELLKSIVHAPAAPLPDGIPELLRMAVDKALQKDPADRYQTMRDLVADLRRVTRTASAATAALRATESGRGSRVSWWVAAGLALLLVAALVPATLYFLRAPPRAAPRIVYELPVPGFAGRNGDLAISPDATKIAYVANVNGTQRIWVRSIGSLESRELPGTENAGGVFWSPDNRYVAFTAGGNLKRIDTAGGPVQNVADSLLGAQGAWGPDGTILFSTPPPAGGGIVVIGRVSANGGSVTQVTAIDAASGQVLHALPALLPDGDRFLYVSAGGGTSTARAGSVQRGDLKPVIGLERPGSGIAYAAGFVLYARDNALVAQRFDTSALAVRGTPAALAERVGQFSVAGDALVYSESGGNIFNNGPSVLSRLAWVDRRGQPFGEIDAPVGYMTPVLSPDEYRLAVRAPDPAGSSGDIWTIDIARGVKTRLTSDPADEGTPLWSPDGARLVFGSGRSGNAAIPNAIYQRAANGTGADELLFAAQAGEVVAPLTWSADGSFLLFGRASLATFRTKVAIWKLELTGERTATPLLDAPFMFTYAQLSPDGRWLAYTSNESGTSQVVVQSFPDLSRDKRQVSTTGGYEPRWRGDGRELFYLAPDGALMALDVPTGDALEPGVPRKLFDTGIPVEAASSGRPDYFYAAAANGERFLLNEPVAASASAAPNAAPTPTPTIHVIANWATGLPER